MCSLLNSHLVFLLWQAFITTHIPLLGPKLGKAGPASHFLTHILGLSMCPEMWLDFASLQPPHAQLGADSVLTTCPIPEVQYSKKKKTLANNSYAEVDERVIARHTADFEQNSLESNLCSKESLSSPESFSKTVLPGILSFPPLHRL